MNTINHTQIEDTLKQLVAGCSSESLTATEALEIFKKFFFTFEVAGFPKNEDRDMALYQCGIYDWGKEKFEVDFTRQLSFEEDGEYVGMKQLHLTLYFDSKLASKETNFNIWYDSSKGSEEWLNSITQSNGFKIVHNTKTTDFKISYEDV